jgi:PHD/YefM family antitoxin component YafN of YafNO toxin-antitoxin module
VSPDDLDALEETLDILRDRDLVASVKRSQEEAAQGRLRPLPSA